MNSSEWRAFLETYSNEILACSEVWERSGEKLSEETMASRWLGFPPATTEMLTEVERRLKTKLPPSLRSFYLLTNGWRLTGFVVWEVLPVERIEWLCDLIPDLYDVALKAEQTVGPFKKDPDGKRFADYKLEQGTRVMRSLVISMRGDASNWLLDPGCVNAEGEWAAGRWSSWNPAMVWLAESFAGLMQQELISFRELREESA